MNKNNGEFQPESHDDSRWDMAEMTPFQHENDKGHNTENFEQEPSETQQEKEKRTKEARENVENVYRKMAPTEKAPNSRPVALDTQELTTHKNPVAQFLKRATTAVGSSALLAASVVSLGAITVAPASAIALVPLVPAVALCAADSVIHSIKGVNGSMFRLGFFSNKIEQRINPFPVFMKHHGETSAEIFKEETRKLFDGLKPGETYSTRSHAMTYHLLREAQREGRISDLTREKTGRQTRLFLENIVTGNWKAIKEGKKHDVYKITFKVI